MDFPILIICMSLLSVLGALRVIFHFYFIFVLRRHIWGYFVCLCSIKRTPGLYGLNATQLHRRIFVIYCRTQCKIKVPERTMMKMQVSKHFGNL